MSFFLFSFFPSVLYRASIKDYWEVLPALLRIFSSLSALSSVGCSLSSVSSVEKVYVAGSMLRGRIHETSVISLSKEASTTCAT